jgi:iron complex transport system ATP-binding protein
LDDRQLAKTPRAEIARRIAYVPQDTHVDFAFTVTESSPWAAILIAGAFRPRRRRITLRPSRPPSNAMSPIFLTVRLTHFREANAHEFLSLEVWPFNWNLLDEPTANLDVEHSQEILELSRTLADSGRAVILASHDLNLIVPYATRVALLQSGQIAAMGAPEEVFQPFTIERVFNVRAEALSTAVGSSVFVFHRKSAS